MISTFADLALIAPIQHALAAEKYLQPTPIQARAIPPVLACRDLLGIAQTGTGKTAAFALPILQRLATTPATRRGVRALVLSPTRELAIQIADSFRVYGRGLPLRYAVVYGGVSRQGQVAALRRGVDVLIATPGRLLDLMETNEVVLSGVSTFVLDEADRMLDIGFIRDIRRIVAALPKERQSLCFSATMPPEVAELCSDMLTNPLRVEATPVATTAERIDQRVFFVDAGNKRALLTELLEDRAVTRALIFTRTKHGANRLAEQLSRDGVRADAIHGNKSQNARERAIAGLKGGALRVLVATDIAARGIDIDGISHVINFELPNVPESYVHRIGRTARAGAEGIALSFCDASERPFLRDIESLTRQPITVIRDHSYCSAPVSAGAARDPRPGRPRQRSSRPPQRGRPMAKGPARGPAKGPVQARAAR